MSMSHARFVIPLAMLGSLPAMPAAALLPAVYSFSTGDPDGRMATASRPGDGSEIRDRDRGRFHSLNNHLDHRRDLHRPAHWRWQCEQRAGRNLPRVSERLGCRQNDRPEDNTAVLDAECADASQFALRHRIRGARWCDGRPELQDRYARTPASPRTTRCNQGASIPNRARRRAGTVPSRAMRLSSL